MPNTCRRQNNSAIPKLNLLLADDHPALRAGLRCLLSGIPGIVVQADLSSGEQAYAWYRAHRPDVVVLDIALTAGFGGVETLRRIIQFDPHACVLVFSDNNTEAMFSRAMSLGALGYVTKISETDVLLCGIREVAQHRGFVSPDMISCLVRKQATPEQSLLQQLSPREFQILLLTGQGQKAGECAQTLNLSEKTVRNHLTRIKQKLNLADTAALTRLAIRAGLTEA